MYIYIYTCIHIGLTNQSWDSGKIAWRFQVSDLQKQDDDAQWLFWAVGARPPAVNGDTNRWTWLMFGCWGLGHIPQLKTNMLEGYLRLVMAWFAPVGQRVYISLLQMPKILRSFQNKSNRLTLSQTWLGNRCEKHRKTIYSKKSVPVPVQRSRPTQ